MSEESLPDPGLLLLGLRYRRMTRWRIEDLAAPHWRWYWNDSPGMSVSIAGRRTPLEPGRVVLIPPRTPCQGRLDRPAGHLWMHFVLSVRYVRARGEVISLPAEPWVARRAGDLRDMLAAVDAQGDDAPALARTMLARMLIYWALGHLAAERLQTHYADERVEAVVEHLRDHLHEKITNARLARLAHMSPNAFIRRFRAVTSSPPRAFLARLRIERACVLLHDPARGIAEVAEQTGFCDRYHFSHVFKEHVGTSPAAFRARVLTGA